METPLPTTPTTLNTPSTPTAATTHHGSLAIPLTVRAWRDHDPGVRAMPGMYLGEIEVTGTGAEAAERLWHLGARRVHLPGTIDLADQEADAARTVQALCLIRDLTSWAIYTDWEVRFDERSDPESWLALSHLSPPLALTGVPDGDTVLRAWRADHYACKCLWRQGPGFVQVRDRRWGELRRFTIDEPEYQEAIARLDHGAPASDVPPSVLADFHEEQLIGQVGDLAWWLPFRVRRWMQEAMAI